MGKCPNTNPKIESRFSLGNWMALHGAGARIIRQISHNIYVLFANSRTAFPIHAYEAANDAPFWCAAGAHGQRGKCVCADMNGASWFAYKIERYTAAGHFNNWFLIELDRHIMRDNVRYAFSTLGIYESSSM